jgi:hypothetical protein
LQEPLTALNNANSTQLTIRLREPQPIKAESPQQS